MSKDELYKQARDRAQRDANVDGFDRGIAWNATFRTYTVYVLPMKKNRFGHELRCEVVSCEHYDRIRPGHGP